jgi:hypothetical protein
MAGLAHYFGIRPWEIDLLTHSEFLGLCRVIEEMSKD